MDDLSQPNNPYNTPDDHLSRLLPLDVEEPWYKSFITNIKEAINPPKLPPLEVTSQPVAVKDIWGLYGRQKKSFMMSTGFQICFVTAVLLISTNKAVQEKAKEAVQIFAPIDLEAYQPKMAVKKQAMGGG